MSGLGNKQQAARTILTRCGLLLGVSLLLWFLLAWPAWKLQGPAGLEGLSIAAVLCCLPGFVVFFLTGAASPTSSRAAMMILFGTGVRLAVVAIGAVVATTLAPYLKGRLFLVWLVVFYLSTLALETLLVLKKTHPVSGGANE